MDHPLPLLVVGAARLLLPVRHPQNLVVLLVRPAVTVVVLLRAPLRRPVEHRLRAVRKARLAPRLKVDALVLVAGQLLGPLFPLPVVYGLSL